MLPPENTQVATVVALLLYVLARLVWSVAVAIVLVGVVVVFVCHNIKCFLAYLCFECKIRLERGGCWCQPHVMLNVFAPKTCVSLE